MVFTTFIASLLVFAGLYSGIGKFTVDAQQKTRSVYRINAFSSGEIGAWYTYNTNSSPEGLLLPTDPKDIFISGGSLETSIEPSPVPVMAGPGSMRGEPGDLDTVESESDDDSDRRPSGDPSSDSVANSLKRLEGSLFIKTEEDSYCGGKQSNTDLPDRGACLRRNIQAYSTCPEGEHCIFVVSRRFRHRGVGRKPHSDHCQTLADAAGYGDRTWKALLSLDASRGAAAIDRDDIRDGLAHAKDYITINGPVYNMGGDLIADDADEFWSDSHQNPINFDEEGNMAPALSIMTGTGSDGNYSNNCHESSGRNRTRGCNCNNYTLNGGSNDGMTSCGDARQTNRNWIFKRLTRSACTICTFDHPRHEAPPFYCVSEKPVVGCQNPDGQCLFTTSRRIRGNSGGMPAAQAACDSAATDAGLTGRTFKPLLGQAGYSHPRDAVEIRGTVYNAIGETVANSHGDFWDGSLLAPLNYDENGNELGASSTSVGVFTAFDETGRFVSNQSSCDFCFDWGDPSCQSRSHVCKRAGYSTTTCSNYSVASDSGDNAAAIIGNAKATDDKAYWYVMTTICTDNHIYCLEELPAPPPPPVVPPPVVPPSPPTTRTERFEIFVTASFNGFLPETTSKSITCDVSANITVDDRRTARGSGDGGLVGSCEASTSGSGTIATCTAVDGIVLGEFTTALCKCDVVCRNNIP